MIYRLDLKTLDLEGLCMTPTRAHALSAIKQAVNEYIINEEGVKKATNAMNLLEGNDADDLEYSGLVIRYINNKNSIELLYKSINNKQNSGWVWNTNEEEVVLKPLYKYGFTTIVQPESAPINIPTPNSEKMQNISPNTMKSLMSYGKAKDHGQHTAVINELKDFLKNKLEKSKNSENAGNDIVDKVEANLHEKLNKTKNIKKEQVKQFQKDFGVPSSNSSSEDEYVVEDVIDSNDNDNDVKVE